MIEVHFSFSLPSPKQRASIHRIIQTIHRTNEYNNVKGKMGKLSSHQRQNEKQTFSELHYTTLER
jgi:hypothetical protein